MSQFIPRSLVRYLSPSFLFFSVLLVLEIFLFFPNSLFWLFITLFLIHIVIVWQLIPKTNQVRLILSGQKVSLKSFIIFLKVITDFEFINFLLPPLLLNLSSFIFIIFLPRGSLRHLVIISVAFFSFLFLRSIYLYFYRPEEYPKESLENISSYLVLITIYFVSAGLLGLIIFANFLLWQAVIIYLLINFLLAYRLFGVSQVKTETSWLFIFVLCLVMGEFFWTVNFLPLNFYVNGLLLTIVFYLFFSLSRRRFSDTLEERLIWYYLILSLIIFLIVLFTAEWR